MSTMTSELSDEYKVAAIGFYMKELHSTEIAADQEVGKRIEGSLSGVIAMDRKGELIPFLHACPQPMTKITNWCTRCFVAGAERK